MPLTLLTPYLKKEDVQVTWWHADGDNQVLGRLASDIARVLIGKNRPDYTPHVDHGDHVIVTNAEKVILTGRRPVKKLYYRHSGYLGHLKTITYARMKEEKPEEVIRMAVRRMLPKSKMGRELSKHLKIYVGAEHPHEAQQPKPMLRMRLPQRKGN